jgi:antitoxin (DNA-binding transcriptional repressor) of toxin-antitoxin stability system
MIVEVFMVVTAMEARRRFGELLNRVLLANEEIIIERAGKKIAKLSRIDDTITPQKQGKLDFRKSRGMGSEIWKDIDVEAYINKERKEWE